MSAVQAESAEAVVANHGSVRKKNRTIYLPVARRLGIYLAGDMLAVEREAWRRKHK